MSVQLVVDMTRESLGIDEVTLKCTCFKCSSAVTTAVPLVMIPIGYLVDIDVTGQNDHKLWGKKSRVM